MQSREMRFGKAGLALLLLLLCSSSMTATAKVHNVNWVHGKPIPNIQACVGDTVVFAWSQGAQHDLIETKVRTCTPNRKTMKTLVPVVLSARKVVKLTAPGTRHFMCSVGLHCVLGQAISVTTAKC